MNLQGIGWLVALLTLAGGGGQTPGNPFDSGPTMKPPSPLTKATKAEILSALSDLLVRDAYVPGMDLGKWPAYLAHERDEIDAAIDDDTFAHWVNVALHDFGVSHIVFYPPREAAERRRTTTVGVGIGAVARRDGITITRVAPKTSADEADLREGDKLLSIDGKTPTTEQLRSPEGSEVRVRVQGASGEIREIRLRSTRYLKTPAPSLGVIDEQAAVLRLRGFDRSYDAATVEGLIHQAKSRKYLVVDLRSNGGGEVSNVQHFLSLFLPAGTWIGTFIGKDDRSRYVARHPDNACPDPLAIARTLGHEFSTYRLGETPYDGKIAVLINGGSASAAEIAAEALRELAGAQILGRDTAGAVLDSRFLRLPYGYEVQFPVRDYVSQGGIRLEGRPIRPDQVADGVVRKSSDPAIAVAVERLRNSG